MPDEGDGEPVVDDSTPSENEDLQPVEEDTSLDANGDGVDDFEFVWNDDFSDGQPPDGNAAGDGSGTGSTATGSAAAGEQMVSYSIEVHKNGTSYVYSQTLAGGSATFTDASGGVTAMVYDGKGSLTSLTDPVSNLTSFTYDSAGNMLSETNAQGTRSYVYDGQNRLVSSVDRNERVREFGYDAGGHFTQERWLTNGAVTHTIDYGYDAGGKLVSAGDALSQYLYTYDANGHLDVVTESGSGLGAVYTFDYDANVASDIVAVTVSVNGSVDHVENYTYDANHRMTQVLQSGANVAAKRVDIAYVDNRVGTLTRYADLSGTQLVATSTFSYAGSQISGISHTQGATVLASLGYTYNAAGLVSSVTTDANTAAYSYDATGQVVGVDNSTLPDEGHQYDANGNRTGAGYAVGSGNRQLSDPRFSYTYDDEGNRTAKVDAITGERTEYVWDARNRLDEVKVETSSGAIVKDVDYIYDALNQKIGKIVKNGSGVIVGEEHYGVEAKTASRSVPVAGMLSQATLDQVSVVTGANGAVTERYVYGPAVDQVLAVDSVGSQVLWMLSDQQGSVRTVISSAGTKLKSIEYDGFGNVVSDSAPTVAVRFLYTGREWDADTQLQNNRARWFDPATGRWLSNDPMGFAAGDVNLQRYVGNGGTNATDPSGLELHIPDNEIERSFWENAIGKDNFTFEPTGDGVWLKIKLKESARTQTVHFHVAAALIAIGIDNEHGLPETMSNLYGGGIEKEQVTVTVLRQGWFWRQLSPEMTLTEYGNGSHQFSLGFRLLAQQSARNIIQMNILQGLQEKLAKNIRDMGKAVSGSNPNMTQAGSSYTRAVQVKELKKTLDYLEVQAEKLRKANLEVFGQMTAYSEAHDRWRNDAKLQYSRDLTRAWEARLQEDIRSSFNFWLLPLGDMLLATERAVYGKQDLSESLAIFYGEGFGAVLNPVLGQLYLFGHSVYKDDYAGIVGHGLMGSLFAGLGGLAALGGAEASAGINAARQMRGGVRTAGEIAGKFEAAAGLKQATYGTGANFPGTLNQTFTGSFADLTTEIQKVFPGFKGFAENARIPGGQPARFNPATNQIEFSMSFNQTTKGLVAEEVRHALDVAGGFTQDGVIAAFLKETGVALVQGGKVVATQAEIRQFAAWHHRRVYTRMLKDAEYGHGIMGKIVGKGDVDSIYELYQLESFGRSPKDWLLQQHFPNLYQSTP